MNIFRTAALSAAIAAAIPALAQDKEPYRYRVGLGAQVVPHYPGADTVLVAPLFDISRARGDKPFEFEAADEGSGFALVDNGRFAFGPVLNMQGGRRREDSHPGLDEVGFSVELGGFADAWLAKPLRLHVELRQAVSGHRAFVGEAGLDFVSRDGDKWLFAIGPRVAFAEEKFHDAYFRVTPREALLTGLPTYDPDGFGIYSAGAAASGIYQLNRRWGLYSYAKYDRLTGDANRSPIARNLGSRDQFSGGLALTYTFGKGIR